MLPFHNVEVVKLYENCCKEINWKCLSLIWDKTASIGTFFMQTIKVSVSLCETVWGPLH